MIDKTIFLCTQCGAQVSAAVAATPLPDMRSEELRGKDLVGRGFYAVNDETGGLFEGNYGINVQDFQGIWNPDPKERGHGCCGADGLMPKPSPEDKTPGPRQLRPALNRACMNGHAVGTERSDCWTEHCVYLVPKLVRHA